jgi:hypothetical protein
LFSNIRTPLSFFEFKGAEKLFFNDLRATLSYLTDIGVDATFSLHRAAAVTAKWET